MVVLTFYIYIILYKTCFIIYFNVSYFIHDLSLLPPIFIVIFK